jgi:hypothetical protein
MLSKRRPSHRALNGLIRAPAARTTPFSLLARPPTGEHRPRDRDQADRRPHGRFLHELPTLRTQHPGAPGQRDDPPLPALRRAPSPAGRAVRLSAPARDALRAGPRPRLRATERRPAAQRSLALRRTTTPFSNRPGAAARGCRAQDGADRQTRPDRHMPGTVARLWSIRRSGRARRAATAPGRARRSPLSARRAPRPRPR